MISDAVDGHFAKPAPSVSCTLSLKKYFYRVLDDIDTPLYQEICT